MTEQALIDFIESELLTGSGAGPIDAETELILSGLLDSLAVMRLVSKIEKERGSKLPEEGMVLENFTTVAAMRRYLDSLEA